MILDPEICYRAVQARDVRYDGRFFTCVRTTGIYCRPICPARPPKLSNCSFVPTAAAAQEAGFRPCLRCRPESSPELDAWRGTLATVSRAWKLIESGALDDGDVAALAERLEIGDRQLRRLFRQHIGAAPITVAQTRRLLLAKQLIHQTNLSMIEVALASGFGSVRRFNETFQRLYQRPPSAIRRHSTPAASSPEITLLLPYQPPYDWEAMLRFLGTRAIEGVETVRDDCYSRLIEMNGAVGAIRVSHLPAQSSLRATIRPPTLSSLPSIVARLRRQFDLSAEPHAIAKSLFRDPMLAPLVAVRPGLRLPGAWDAFEIAIRAVLGQQITVKAASRLAARLVSELGTPVDSSMATDGLTHTFPRVEDFCLDSLAKMGMPRSRMETLVAMADAFRADVRLFEPRRDLAESIMALRAIRGVGEWTAQYIALRAMGESDAFLAGDVALQRLLADGERRPSAKQLLEQAESWRPWRGYAVMHLWAADSESNQNLLKKERSDAITA
jgi:AraC family transcriptional regulator of adaptative response / DNA-3-methyladenine glycosylase II